jgi:hypothetical protein
MSSRTILEQRQWRVTLKGRRCMRLVSVYRRREYGSQDAIVFSFYS